jgi:hypothetical protein
VLAPVPEELVVAFVALLADLRLLGGCHVRQRRVEPGIARIVAVGLGWPVAGFAAQIRKLVEAVSTVTRVGQRLGLGFVAFDAGRVPDVSL